MTVDQTNPNHKREIDNYLWVLLQQARSTLSRARDLELAQYGLTIEQMSILHTLMINGGSATIDEIAATTVRQKNSVTTLVERMSKAGLVKKEKSKQDKKYRISLTEKSQTFIANIPRKSIEMVFEGFADEDKEQLAKYLENIVDTGHDLLGKNYVPPFLLPKPSPKQGLSR